MECDVTNLQHSASVWDTLIAPASRSTVSEIAAAAWWNLLVMPGYSLDAVPENCAIVGVNSSVSA
jgi:hypothetical protein